MPLATETDPVDSLKDLLTGTVDSDWDLAGAKPTHIEATEESERRVKEERAEDAVYLQATIESDHTKLDPEGNQQDELAVVTAEFWTVTSAAQASALKRDCIELIANLANDSNTTTSWVDWRVQEAEDFTGQKDARGGDHYVKSLAVRLRDLRSV